MKIGMLWFDGDRSVDLSTRIERAAVYYREKYGRMPNLCLLHPKTSGESTPRLVSGVKILTNFSVLPDHFWLGIEEQTQPAKVDSRISAQVT